MANTLLTPDDITKEALFVLHQKANFLGAMTRGYDNRFGKEGAKIGDTLRIRLPNQFKYRTGNTMSSSAVSEQYVSLQVSNVGGVDMSFTSNDLALDINDFSNLFIKPAMSTIAANVEADVFAGLIPSIYNVSDEDATAFTFTSFTKGGKILVDNLVPRDGSWKACLGTSHAQKIQVDVKDRFNPVADVSGMIREGQFARMQGTDIYENVHMSDHTTGTAGKTTGYLTNDLTAQTGASLTVDTGSDTFLKGDVITIAGVNRVDPETKVDTGQLQQFVITADSGANATSLAISPSIVASGALQNVTNGAADGKAIVKVAAGASEKMNGSLMFHPAAFVFATAPMLEPEDADFFSQQEMDGLSIRIWRQSDIINNQMLCRLDIQYGYLAARPQMAVRLHADG